MKSNLLLITFMIIAFGACKKNSDSASLSGLSGTYSGTVVDSLNGSFHATFNHSITLIPTNTPNQLTVVNNLIMTNNAIVSGSNFEIPRTTAMQSPNRIIEWAKGTFTGTSNNTLKITFYQEVYLTSNNNLIMRTTRTCNLIKQ